MKSWRLYTVKSLPAEVVRTAQVPRQPTQELIFVNDETGQVFSTTDLVIKKAKRNHVFDEFRRIYSSLLIQNRLTVLGFVVSSDVSPSEFISMIKKKLKRKLIVVFGYIWSRDIGEVMFKQHLHCLISCSWLTKNKFIEIFDETNQKYSVQLIRSLGGMKEYLSSKELYADYGQRAWSRSNHFKIPQP